MTRRSFLSRFITSLAVAAILLTIAAGTVSAVNNPQISTVAKNAALAAITAKIDTGGAGTLLMYTGTQPAGPDTAITSQVLLVTLTYSATSFGAPSGGVATANAITSGTAVATGTATWCRSLSGAGTPVIDLAVGTSASDINLGSVAIASGQVVSITSLTLTHP